jgi:hypothetical protein
MFGRQKDRSGIFPPILHVAAGAVDSLVKILSFARLARQGSDDKSWIRHNRGCPPASAPAVAGRPHEILETAGGFADALALRLSPYQFVVDFGDQALVLGQAEQIINAMRLAPTHQLLAGKTAIGTQQNANKMPINLAKKFGASVYASAREFARTNHRACVVYVLEPTEFVDAHGAQATVRRIEPSPSFAKEFGRPQYTVITLDHPAVV